MVKPNRQYDWKSTNKHGLIIGPKPSQLYRELMGVMSLSPYDGNNSESRKQMFGSHIGQRLTISGANERRIQTGMEREYGKYTFALRMPVTGTIIRLIERYPSTLGLGGIAHNPEILVIYENDETKEVGCFSIVEQFTHHPYFGFKYKRRAAMSMLRAGESIREGTILQDSPAISEDGAYHYGRELNVAYMSIPGVSEDGVVISRDMLKYFATKKYETRVVEFGKNYIPTNLYGDENHYKAHPDIGDPIGPHGILMNLRARDENLAPVEQSINSTRRINPTFDRKIYADGPGGRVVDIRVQHDPNSTAPITPPQMVSQTSVYDKARRRFYQEILNEYYRLKKNRGGGLNISPEFHRWVTEAISVVNPTSRREGSEGSERVSKLYKGVPLDDWRIEFVIEYDVLPTIGFKVTDTHGGKGVLCKICEPHEMPVDAAGNRADMIMSPEARVSRMNLGGLIEPFVNATARDLVVDLVKQFGLEANPKAVTENYVKNHPYFQTAWQRLMRFYEITSPKHMHAGFASEAYAAEGGTPQYHMCSVIKDGIYLYSPPENEIYVPKMVKELEAEFPSVYGPVTYVGNSGIRRTTVENVRIGSMYIMLLEKIGDDWAAVSSGKWQNFGVLAQITNRDKYATATREQATRAWGEAEFRIVKANIPGNIVAEIHDRNNNILSHREVLWSLYRADQPSNIKVAVDRNKIPFGQARPLQLVKHLAFCGGWEFKYSPYRSDIEVGITDEDWAKEVKE